MDHESIETCLSLRVDDAPPAHATRNSAFVIKIAWT